MLEQKTELIN